MVDELRDGVEYFVDGVRVRAADICDKTRQWLLGSGRGEIDYVLFQPEGDQEWVVSRSGRVYNIERISGMVHLSPLEYTVSDLNPAA